MKDRVLLPIEKEQLAAVEKYRRRQGLANRAATIRHLIERGLSASDPLAATIKALREMRAELADKGVVRAAVFGSVARGDSAADSDIDIVLEFDPQRLPDLIGYLSLRECVANVVRKRTGRRVDVTELGSVRPGLGAAIERDAIYAF